jgi:hypothetical protein
MRRHTQPYRLCCTALCCAVTALRTPKPMPIARRDLFRGTAAALVMPKPAAAATTVAAAKAALLDAIPATATGAPATNATLPRTVSEKISACADALDAATSMKDTASNKQLDGSWRLVYSDAPEITNLAKLPLGFQLGPVRQPFSLQSKTFENQGEILHVTRLLHGSTRVVGDFDRAARGTLNAAGVVNDRGDRVDVFFRRVVFEIDAPVAIKTVVEPKADPSLARPAVDTVYLDDSLRVTRGGDGSLFVLTRDADPVPMLTAAERRELYGEASQDVVSGAGLGNWSRTTKGVFSSTDVSGRE